MSSNISQRWRHMLVSAMESHNNLYEVAEFNKSKWAILEFIMIHIWISHRVISIWLSQWEQFTSKIRNWGKVKGQG